MQALIFNYITAFVLGITLTETALNELQNVPNEPWFIASLLLGVLFILVFSLMAKTTQTHGVGVVSVASKMSLSLPVLFVFLVYKEPVTFYKILGFILALAAVFLISYTKPKTVGTNLATKSSKWMYLLPLWVFLGSGIIETSIKYIQEEMLTNSSVASFSAFVFFSAATTGVLIRLSELLRGQSNRKLLSKQVTKSLIGGICLGVPNFFSVYFFIQALQSNILTSAGVFIINNVSIVVIATFLGIILFNEKFELKNKIGIMLALLSICLIFVEAT